MRSVLHYMQRTALQGHPTSLSRVMNVHIKGAETRTDVVHPFRKVWDQLQVGDTLLTHRRTVTEADIVHFAGLSGDYFYAHVDDIAARESPIFNGGVALRLLHCQRGGGALRAPRVGAGARQLRSRESPLHQAGAHPCNIVRGLGLHHKLRYLMRALCEDFRDVEPRFEHNYCCGAGGGAINCGPPWKITRMRSTKVKADQFRATGAHTIVTPCPNCHSGIEDVIGYYGLKMHVAFISELLMKTIERPEG